MEQTIFNADSTSLVTSRTGPDVASEIARLEELLAEKRRELAALQEAMQEFRALYTRVVGSKLAELAEVEHAIREAERKLLGESEEEEPERTEESRSVASSVERRPVLRRLFWAVAKMFHPDHAADPQEAQRRHAIMAEASRAYCEGDVESLNLLLNDESLQSHCVASRKQDETRDPAAVLLDLKEELITVEFGIKRLKQDPLYRVKLKVEEAAEQGRDALAEMADDLSRQIAKARRRLSHLVA